MKRSFLVFFVLLLCTGCGKPTENGKTELIVFAAASLTETVSEIAAQYESAHPDVSIVLNFVICFAAIPFMTITIALMQIVVSSNDPVYQIALCVPAITAFTLAASVALRRIRFPKTGFFLQFLGPVLFVLTLILTR